MPSMCGSDESHSPGNNQRYENENNQNPQNSEKWSQIVNASPRNLHVHPEHTADQIQWNKD